LRGRRIQHHAGFITFTLTTFTFTLTTFTLYTFILTTFTLTTFTLSTFILTTFTLTTFTLSTFTLTTFTLTTFALMDITTTAAAYARQIPYALQTCHLPGLLLRRSRLLLQSLLRLPFEQAATTRHQA